MFRPYKFWLSDQPGTTHLKYFKLEDKPASDSRGSLWLNSSGVEYPMAEITQETRELARRFLASDYEYYQQAGNLPITDVIEVIRHIKMENNGRK